MNILLIDFELFLSIQIEINRFILRSYRISNNRIGSHYETMNWKIQSLDEIENVCMNSL